MSTHNIHFMIKLKKKKKKKTHKKNTKISIYVCFLGLSREFPMDSKKRVRISHGKRAIGVRVLEVLL